MRGKNSTLQLRLYLIGACILVAGLLGAALVYRSAAEDGGDAVGFEVVGGNVYSIAPADSKPYRHDLELYGGKAAVLADDFNRWFDGLWQGRGLAYTLALLAVAIALACFLAGHRLSDQPSKGQTEDQDG
jgi:hypothetical protein